MTLTATTLLIGVACIVGANLLLVGLRQLVDLPLADGLESAIASGLGAGVWMLIVQRKGR